MFWRFGGYSSISTIDSLLDKPDVSLEELLDESELIQELKQLNTKLIEYLREDDVLKKLMDYVVAPSLVNDNDDDDDQDTPSNDEARQDDSVTEKKKKKSDPLRSLLDPEDLERAEKERLKRAYVACEVLSSEVWSILDSIMANPEYLRDFWGFIRRPAPLDSIQASYFTKVNETLLDKKTGEMLELLKSMDDIVPAILQHVDNPMVMDLLLKLISLERAEGGQGIVDWLKTQDLIPKLLSFLSPEWPASVQTSAGDFLKAIITISANATQNDQSCIGPNSLTRQLVSVPCVESLVKAMLQGGNSLTVGVGIVIEVIRKNNSDYDPEHLNGPDSMPSMYDPIYLGTLLRVFAKHIPDFMALIQSSKHTVTEGGKIKSVERGQLNSAWGAKIEPLGFDRFKTCELMAELLHCSNMGLLNEPGSDEYVLHRDAERERIMREGPFGQHIEDNSTFDGNDSTVDFVNGSIGGFASPEDSRAYEPAHTGDEGFEDVSSSTVLVDKEKETSNKGSEPDSAPAVATPQQPQEGTALDESQEQGQPGPPKSGTPPSETLSPTDELAARIGAVSLDPTPSNDDNQKPSESKPGESATEQEPAPASAPMSSNPDAVPAPLFATKEQNPEATPATADPKAAETAENEPEPLPGHDSFGHAQQPLHPDIQLDINGQPVVGDYLKIMFVENRVVPTILDFFFRFPWNNFLHNVVYDVIQQVFNGPMDRGYNRVLAIDVFETGKITQAIFDGQKRSDETQQAKRIRLGYMGHLTLIAEEVVKFSERHPPELLSPTVMDSVLNPEWIDYVEQTLSETRERDNAILGGVRPDISIGHRQGMLGTGQSSALAEAGLNGMAGNSNFQGFDMSNQGSVSGGAFGASGNNLLSGFASSSDDDEDEDMEDQDDRHIVDQSREGGTENALSQPIPIIAPPPAPLSTGPSRARRQLAARLAAQKQAAENAEGDENRDEDPAHASTEFQWPSDSFANTSLNEGGHSSDFPSGNLASPTFPDTGFSPSDSFSTGSSDDDNDLMGTSRRKERVPLEVDDDDDDMGEMVAPSMESHMMDSDEEEAILNESLGYPELGPGQYKNFRSSRMGHSPYGDDPNDSSEDEDEGLVEILVPSRKSQ
ncbi:SIT4 phosphatase-associated protein-domain-containing protein [Aspergillus granulosus]|uniref:SIT4 phosphatase-associated protein-domain-containing protein n=1 Tax=Aspergillus granulosus TaxID=176169 RepID=A0ABR4HVI3_9EURO